MDRSPKRRRKASDTRSPEELLQAARRGDAASVAAYLKSPTKDPNTQGSFGASALVLAAQNGHDGVMALLLADGRVDRNVADWSGDTALLRRLGPALRCALLADAAMDPTITNKEGKTALYSCAQNGHAAVVCPCYDERLDPNGATTAASRRSWRPLSVGTTR